MHFSLYDSHQETIICGNLIYTAVTLDSIEAPISARNLDVP